MALPIVIRRCKRADLSGLEWFGAFTPHREIIAATFAAQERGDAIMLVAMLGDAPIGQVWIDLNRSRADHAGYIWALRVFPWFQGRRIGSRLLRAAEAAAAEAGCLRAELVVEHTNPKARALYERSGYVPHRDFHEITRFRRPDGSEGSDEIAGLLLRKPLTRAPDPIVDVTVSPDEAAEREDVPLAKAPSL